MIKINLAVRKQSGVSSDGKGGRLDPSSWMGKVDLHQVKDLPFKRLVAPLGIVLVASHMLGNYQEDEVAKLSLLAGRINGENGKLQTDLAKFKAYDTIKQTMDEDEGTIKAKLEIIKKLMSDRTIPVKIIIAMSSAIPKDVWLGEFKISQTETSLKGTSLGLGQLSDFMKSLRDLPYFSSVDLIDTQQTRDQSGLEVASFELKAKRR